MTRLVILDFDGTLADTQPIIVGSIQRTLAELGLPARSDAECAAIIGLPLVECFERLLTPTPLRGTPPCEGGAPRMHPNSSPSQGEVPEGRRGVAERCADRYREIFDELNTGGAVRLFPHVLDTIKALHAKGLQLAICSSRGRPTLEGFVRDFQLEPYVEMVVSANDVQHHKPHPEPVQIILDKLGIPAEETLVVGDASYDILMGRAAGCRTCGVTYGNQSADQLRAAGADHLIDRFDALPDCL